MTEFQVRSHQCNGGFDFELIGSGAGSGNFLQVVEPQGNPAAGSIEWISVETPSPPPCDPIKIEPSYGAELRDEDHIETFDADSGPSPPSWKAWSTFERDSLIDVTQTLQERQAHFDFGYLLDPIRAFINKARSGYLLVEGQSGVGKSYLGAYLEGMAAHVHPSGIRVAYLRTARRPHGDYETFIESINDQLACSLAPRSHRIMPLDRMALHDLAVQYPSPKLQQRWTAFVTSLSVSDRGPILLYLDEIDRRHSHDPTLVNPLDYLPDPLPDGVFIIVPFRPDASPAFLRQLQAISASQTTRLTLEPVTSEYRDQLDRELTKIGGLRCQPAAYQAVLQASEFRLHYSRLALQAWVGDLIDPVGQCNITDLYRTIFDSWHSQRPEPFARVQNLLMTLCAAFEPVAWEDLEEWGISIETIRELVGLLPATLVQHKLTMFLSTVGSRVDIAHESLRKFLIQQNQEAFASVCRTLIGWAVQKIQAFDDLKLQSEQGQELARLTFYRLYRWSLLCQDVSILEWVVRNKELQSKRIAISQSLETSARPHQKLGLLDLWVEALRVLVQQQQRHDLADELAWALNSRGLTYLTLHRRQRALNDLDQSLKLFDILVHQEGKSQFRNGLAAAYNRRSEMHFALQQLENALADSTQAVQLFTDLVEKMGRQDLLPSLALALRNQSQVWAASHNPGEATRSMEAALKIFRQLSVSEGDRYTLEQATCLLQLSQQQQKSNQPQESLRNSDQAVSMLSQGHFSIDTRSLLEQAHLARGISYLAGDQPGEALGDFTHSIKLSAQLLGQGRLDQRDELAESYAFRSQAQLRSGQLKEAIGDLSKSIEFRQLLVTEGRSDQGLELARAYLQRAELYRQDSREEACLTDLSAARAILVALSEAGENVSDLLLTLYRQRAVLGMQSGRYKDVVHDADQALHLLQAGENPNSEEVAQLLFLRGEGHRRRRESDQARADFEACIQVFTDLLQVKGGMEYLVAVAAAYGNLSRVSLLSGHLERAQQQVNRSVEALEVSLQNVAGGDGWANLAQAYSTRAEVLQRLGQHHAARQDLTRAMTIYSRLVDSQGQKHLLDEQALAYRRLGRTLLSLKEANPARAALDEASQRYKELWSKDPKGPWLDELSRTQVVRSAVSVALKEFRLAEEEIQRSQEHFTSLLDQGKPEYFDDVFQASMQRLNNLLVVGLDAKASDELTRLFDLVKRTAERYGQIDFRVPWARLLQSKAGVLATQHSLEQAYDDLEAAILLLQPLVFEEKQFDLGKDLTDIYRQRAGMLLAAGKVQSGLADLSQAAQILTSLLSQGSEELRRPLAEVAQQRAAVHFSQNEWMAAMDDLNLGVDLLMSLSGCSDDPDLAHMLCQRGRCHQQIQQIELASEDFEKACQIYCQLVETQGRDDLSSILAGCLLSHFNLSGQGIDDPHRRKALIEALRALTQQTSAGNPPPESLVLNAITVVRNSLSRGRDQASEELAEVVIRLCVAVLQGPSISYAWVNLTELLSQCYLVLSDVKGPRYMSFLCLSCVSSGREVGSLGAVALPRLIYFLTLLGVALNSELPGEHLSLVGNAFTLLLEQLARQPWDEQQVVSLRQLVSTWQQLPACCPAAAGVSRGMLTHLRAARPPHGSAPATKWGQPVK